MDVYEIMSEKGLTLPQMPVSGGNYSLVVKSGNLVYTSGQTPKENGVLLMKGKVGATVSPEDGYKLARRAALNALTAIESLIGNLNNITRVVKATVFVSSDPSFTGQAKVANGATDMLVELFGDNGRPVRSAVGMSVLPGDAPVEVELIVEINE